MKIPENWTQPKYRLGQRIKQGMVVGCEYYPEGTKAAYQYGSIWRYTVIPHNLKDAENIEYYRESEIKSLSTAELKARIQEEIDFHHKQLENLQTQIFRLEGE